MLHEIICINFPSVFLFSPLNFPFFMSTKLKIFITNKSGLIFLSHFAFERDLINFRSEGDERIIRKAAAAAKPFSLMDVTVVRYESSILTFEYLMLEKYEKL